MTDSSVAARRVALVTGGARGIGRAIAEGLRAIGAAVVVLDADGDALDACGLDGLKIRADIASPDDSAAAVARVCELHGRLDILVNNAGLGMGTIREDHFARPVALAEITPEHWRRMFEVNCMGAFLMMRAAVPGMVTRGWGRVVNITTSFFTMLNQGFAPYGPAKAAALEAASAIWAKEFAGTGVTVNVLIPGGPTDTRMVPRSAPFSRSALIPPAALAWPPAQWLVSAAADGITGRRFTAGLWDPALTPAGAAARAGAPIAWPELIDQGRVWPGR
jgi:NAD(P)-dependent dehydrogenase (short-subunit alcohol dehydrogenase family)